jgi:hypothetical protein
MKDGLAISVGRHQGGSSGLQRIAEVGMGFVLVDM